MAGNNIVVGSKFRPFSYDEMIKPIQLAQEQHMAIEEEMSNLATRADVFEKLANEQTDPMAYNMYKNYANDLSSQVDVLSKEGLTPGSRQGLLDMRRRYSSEITPIEQAYKRREELTKEQREALLKDPTLLLSREAATLSLDDLINNPNMSYQSISGNMLTQQAAQAAKELAKYQQEKPREWRRILGGQYFETMMNRGYTPEQVLMAAMDDPNAPKELKKIADDVYASSGIDVWGDNISKQRAKEFIGRGLYSAIGDTQYQQVQNQEYLDPLQRAKLAALNALKDRDKPYRSVARTTVSDTETTKLKDDINFLTQLKENPDLLKKTDKRFMGQFAPSITGGGGYAQITDYMPNVERLKQITSKYGTTDPDAIIDAMNKEIRSSARRNSSYIVDITDPSLIAKNLRENSLTFNRMSGTSGIYELDDNKKGDQVDTDEINKYFTKDTHLEYDPQKGIVLTGVSKDGKEKSFLLDPEVVTGRTIIDEESGRRLNQYQAVMNAIDDAIDSGDERLQEIYIDLLMRDMYSQFNSLSKKQSNTLSSKEEEE